MNDIIQLLDSTGGKVIDSISVDYEDSFCLETFGDLAAAFNKAGSESKCFIIARVQTWDHKQPGKAFYSYYHAYHLNKILFQTQVYLGKKLIHRLHVLNPLTNTDIIGNVQYFMVKRREVPVVFSKIKKETTALIVISNEVNENENENQPILNSDLVNQNISDNKRKPSLIPKFFANMDKNVASREAELSSTVKEIESGIVQTWNLGPAVNVAIDDTDIESKSAHKKITFSKTSRIKAISYKHALNPPISSVKSDTINIPITPLSVPPTPPTPLVEPLIPLEYKKRTYSIDEQHIQQLGEARIMQEHLSRRRHTAVTISVQRSPAPLQIGSANQVKKLVLPGFITKFGVQIPKNELKSVVPPTVKTRRRSLSYANSITASGAQATIEEWRDMVKKEKDSLNFEQIADYDTVRSFGTFTKENLVNSTSRKGILAAKSIRKESTKEKIEVISEEVHSGEERTKADIHSEKEEDIMWDATLFATDTDFLESSKTRMIFRNNALVPEDVMLFKMKEHTGEGTASVEVIMDDDVFFLDCCYPTQQQLQNSTTCTRLFHHFKCYGLVCGPSNSSYFIELSNYNTLKFFHLKKSKEIQLVSTNCDFNYMKCIAWSMYDTLAIGLQTGKILLTAVDFLSTSPYTYPESPQQSRKLDILGELIPPHSRSCNVVAFCPNDPNLLLTGLDKVRNDFCLMIYDTKFASINAEPTEGLNDADSVELLMFDSDANIKNHTKCTSEKNNSCTAPIAQLGSSEAVSSADWFFFGNKTLVSGMGNKWLKIYDLRLDGSTPTSTISTRAVSGLVCDSLVKTQFASYAEDGIIRVWDIRKLKSNEPVISFPSDLKEISEISWSTSRSGLLSAIGKDSDQVKLWDIKKGICKDANSFVQKKNFNQGNVSPLTTMSQLTSSFENNNLAMNLSTSFGNSLVSPVGSQNSPIDLEKVDDYQIADTTILWKMRQVVPLPESVVTGFSFVPSEGLKLFVITSHKETVKLTAIDSCVNTSWNPIGNLAAVVSLDTSSGEQIQIFGCYEDDNVGNCQLKEDISWKMRVRAETGYSLNARTNVEVVSNDNELRNLWSWMLRTEESAKKGKLMMDSINYTYFGIYDVIQDMINRKRHKSVNDTRKQNRSSNNLRKVNSESNLQPSHSCEMDREKAVSVDGSKKFFKKSNQDSLRELGLQMCGLSFANEAENKSSNEETLEQAITRMESVKQYEKAAGMALFFGEDLNRAIQTLNDSKVERLKLVATVLAGFNAVMTSTDDITLWKSLCKSLSLELKDPYLRSIFTLLSSDGDWKVVLSDEQLSVPDKIGIALRFLDDKELLSYVEKLMEKLVKQGNLEGLLLTGFFSTKCLDLFDNFLERTSDIQTVGVLLGLTSPLVFLQDDRIDEWITIYRSLLDRWQLYHIRAKFDIARRQIFEQTLKAANVSNSSYSNQGLLHHIPPSISVKCNFCGSSITESKKSLSTSGIGLGSIVGLNTGGISGKHKITSCPNCRKPLPRCSLCLLHMGTPVDTLNYPKKNSESIYMNGVDQWFTWCASCSHGGHGGHINDWFEIHDICPVSDCDCKCSSKF